MEVLRESAMRRLADGMISYDEVLRLTADME
jgi:hypothetical protein